MISLPGTGGGLPRGPVAFHLILVAALVVGAAFDDPLGRLLRGVGAVTALLGCLVVLTGRLGRTEAVPAWAMEVYPLVMAAVIAGYGLLLGHRISLAVAGVILSSWLVVVGWRGYCSARQAVVGLDYLAIGMVLFALAVLTSVVKGGVLPWGFWNRKGKVSDSIGSPTVEGAATGEPSLRRRVGFTRSPGGCGGPRDLGRRPGRAGGGRWAGDRSTACSEHS